MNTVQIAAVALGGALGAVARYWTVVWVSAYLGRDFPYGTLVVNVTGSLLIGFLSVILLERVSIAPEWRNFLIVGLLGAFTTFSTFSLDTLYLLQQAAVVKALLNVFANVLFCLIAAYVGTLLAKVF